MATSREPEGDNIKRPTDLSARSRLASLVIRNQLAEIQGHIVALQTASQNTTLTRNELFPIADTAVNSLAGKGEKSVEEPQFKVGIVGAGCAGLFTAMIFDHLKTKFGLKVEYDILEASNEDRFGGRLYSHYFKDVENPGKHDYYDVGAMRFPDIGIMARTFELFNYLDMTKVKNPTKKNPPKTGQLVKYWLTGEQVPILYNDYKYVDLKNATAADFNISTVQGENAFKTTEELVDVSIKEFTDAYPKGKFPTDPEEIRKYQAQAKQFWDLLLSKGDSYTVRTWLNKSLDYNTIEWMETLNFGNRWYDQALSEMILETLDFDAEAEWWCVEGGSSEITNRMRKKIEEKHGKGKILFNKRVTEMNLLGINTKDESVTVSVHGESSQPRHLRKYDAVFNSAPLGSMQRMKLQGLHLNYGTKQAIRNLGYGASCKVGIRFKKLWWRQAPFNIKGGVAKTDLTIRACVYPSYNLEDDTDEPGVLLCSYTWSQEAQRIASLINRDSPKYEDELKETIIDNLARLHAIPGKKDYWSVRDIIEDNWETHFAFDWYADPHTTGAFAYFGPSQFANQYPWIVRNNGKHIIIGEAASAHHAWVVGALESAVRGVYQFLVKHETLSPAAKAAKQAYEKGEIAEPFGPLPAEFNRIRDVKYPPTQIPGAPAAKVAPPAAEGEFLRQGVLFETRRLAQRVNDTIPDKLDAKKLTVDDVGPLIVAARAVQTVQAPA